MAVINYKGIRDAVQSILQADSRTSGARIYVEEEPQFGVMDKPAIALFMDRRTMTHDQSLSTGKRTRYEIKMMLITVYFSLNSFHDACDGRDNLLAQLEATLMDNRTLNDTVKTMWLEGGELFSARDSQNNAFVAVGETGIVAEASVINT